MDLARLNELIVDSGITKVALAKKLSISAQGLYYKLNGKNDFTRREVGILCEVLQITNLKEKESLFFSDEVANSETENLTALAQTRKEVNQ